MFSTADDEDFTLSSWSALTDAYASELQALRQGDARASAKLENMSRRLERYRVEMSQRQHFHPE